MRLSPPVKAAAQRLALPMLVFVAGTLTVLGKGDLLLIDKARSAIADTMAPALEFVSQPLAAGSAAIAAVENVVTVYRQNDVLREENQRLLQWEEVARRLAAENRSLRDLDKLVPDHVGSQIAARVIADSGGAFVRNVLVNAGTRDGVARGQAGLTGEGLIGRVSEVGERTARVLLLTDLNSHIPVMLERTSARALLDGDNSDRPRLAFLDAKAQIDLGDRVVTSGSGGVFPPGLPVGTVTSLENGIARVEPYSELSRLDIVRVVDYGLEGVLPQSAVPPPRATKPAKGRAAADAPR
ncbi:MAG TPA: rod shape-determining protein MreC [Stellaceae bacterium]|nr:rod shape-determining protein MreC [Stellaceae bacterium]